MNPERKHKRYILPLTGFCIALLLAACSPHGLREEELLPPEAGETGEVYFTLGLSEEAETRAGLEGPEDVHHVNRVQLYIFEGTDNDAKCVASEDVEWEAYFGDKLPVHSAEMTYKVKYQGFMEDALYTFLAVGTNSEGTETFGVPGFIGTGSTAPGSLEAAWITGKTRKDMAASELFVGTSVLKYSSLGLKGSVEMKRRVAGVMCWLTNVPTVIKGVEVKEARIVLYAPQNTKMPLLRRSQSPLFEDFITSPSTETDGQVLVGLPVPDRLDATVSGGSFVFPADMPPPSDTGEAYTLRMELTDAGGNVLHTRRIHLPEGDPSDGSTGGGTGIIDPEGSSRFPIIANHFYGVGSKDKPVDAGGNNIIIVSINPEWDEIDDDMDVIEK